MGTPTAAVDAIDEFRSHLELVEMAKEIVCSENDITEKSAHRILLLLEAFLAATGGFLDDHRLVFMHVRDSRPADFDPSGLACFIETYDRNQREQDS